MNADSPGRDARLFTRKGRRRLYSLRASAGARRATFSLRLTQDEYRRAYERAAAAARAEGRPRPNLSAWARDRLVGSGGDSEE